MLYLKMMSAQNAPDANPSKNFALVPIPDTIELHFNTEEVDNGPGAPQSTIVTASLLNSLDGSERRIHLTGNAYVLNEQGKTIASHAAY
jgi:hypothetical protein